MDVIGLHLLTYFAFLDGAFVIELALGRILPHFRVAVPGFPKILRRFVARQPVNIILVCSPNVLEFTIRGLLIELVDLGAELLQLATVPVPLGGIFFFDLTLDRGGEFTRDWHVDSHAHGGCSDRKSEGPIAGGITLCSCCCESSCLGDGTRSGLPSSRR